MREVFFKEGITEGPWYRSRYGVFRERASERAGANLNRVPYIVKKAAAEVQKILDHRNLVVNFITGTLAHPGLARAYALQGETTKARAAYNDFVTIGFISSSHYGEMGRLEKEPFWDLITLT